MSRQFYSVLNLLLSSLIISSYQRMNNGNVLRKTKYFLIWMTNTMIYRTRKKELHIFNPHHPMMYRLIMAWDGYASWENDVSNTKFPVGGTLVIWQCLFIEDHLIETVRTLSIALIRVVHYTKASLNKRNNFAFFIYYNQISRWLIDSRNPRQQKVIMEANSSIIHQQNRRFYTRKSLKCFSYFTYSEH